MAGKVYIIGAGASKNETLSLPISMPLANEFFQKVYIDNFWNHNEVNFESSSLLKILVHYFNFNKDKNFDVNIEEIYSFLETFLNSYKFQLNRIGKNTVENAKIELLQYVYDVIRFIPWNFEDSSFYNFLASNIDENDSIITFNWDTMLESALRKTKMGKRLLANQNYLLNPLLSSFSNQSNYEETAKQNLHKGYFLKLHGSINLALCTNDKCWHNSIPFRFSTREELPELWACHACGNPLRLFIMPPFIHKSYNLNRFFQLQANLAVEKLSIAEEVIIVGYAFPIYDIDVQTLFRVIKLGPSETSSNHWLDKVTIVNPQIRNRSYISNIKNILGLNNAKETYGHKILLSLYDSIEKFLKDKGNF
ncbi:hypothetical protein EHV15_26485 [Paenibacillus oralis]|uniref:Deacetylase sirtuin-type domain-containing protein n=1 Tax=Paenibacillus oralis TaxID=2490856 RepID=A0A3P3U8N9_9BACL|nr:hypothetical protein [Paenibacillus oralis]RRJ66066.1 hypothetical protein EHV15_26485 [Paenibacillus oralis]